MLNKKLFKNKVTVVFVFLLISFCLHLLINYLEKNEIDKYKTETYRDKVLESKVYLNTLIKEKQNATATIGLGLSRNNDIIDALKSSKINPNLLKEYSKRLMQNTDFKNVWFQLISKEGISIQRSWTDYHNDKISDARVDLQKALRSKRLMSTISVGKYDMTFKGIVPIYDYDNTTFLGVVEVITHFNSIAKKLEEKKIDALVLADKKYEKQLTKALSGTFIDGYYVANLEAKKGIIDYLKQKGVDKYLNYFASEEFVIDFDLHSVVSYYKISDVIDNSSLGHIFLLQNIEKIDMSKIDYIKYIHNIYLLFSIIILALVFYFFNTIEVKSIDGKSFSLKVFATILIVYLSLAFSIYKLVQIKYIGDIENYKQNVINQTMLEYNSIVQKNKDISEFIFLEMIDRGDIKTIFKQKDRDTLHKVLLKKYRKLSEKYNLRQLHFHLPDSSSFLRMHKPSKYGDSLVGIRQSVEYVNKTLKSFYGFEEGRIYNGFRYVFPLIDANGVHLGSVETSFDIKSFIDNYMKFFDTTRVNFLINEEVVKTKVFSDQQSNYIKSPVEGFYFDKIVLEKLASNNSKIVPHKADKEKYKEIAKKITRGLPFSIHFPKVNELTVVIPLVNKISGEVIGSLNVSKSDKFIRNRLQEFNQLIVIILIVMGFIMFFIYREFLSKMKAKIESQNNQKILDSQNSFIVITDGMEIKRVNNTVLEFFGYENLEEFKEEHDCICDFFVAEKGKKYIQKYMGELNWFEYLKIEQNDNRQVKIYDKDKQPHIFYIEFDPQNITFENNYIVTFIDITHLINIENQLLYSEKMASLGNMIGNIAHQWRQPLSIISTCASGVSMKHQYGLLNDEEIEQNMDHIVENTKYLSETIDTFRDFIKDNNSKEYIQIDIKESIGSVLKIMEASLKNNYIEVTFNSDDNLFKTMAYGEFTQVITNLINNAKDVLKERNIENPIILIEAKKIGNSIEITVEDNGGGIDEEIIDKIFEPYFTTKHKSMGTGLGLYICHKILSESLNGDLIVKNTTLGAKFVIRFPLDK